MAKPIEIIELEKLYGIEQKQLPEYDWSESNYFVLNNKGEVIALDLSGLNIELIEGLEKLTQLQELNLSYNQIQKIENLEKLTQLQKLYLANNQIQKIENLDKLTQLQKLDLSANQIQRIENLDKLTQLQKLDLSNNQIQKIENLDKLNQLQGLDLVNNQIRRIENLEKLTQLQELNLSNNQIQKIENLDKLTQLQGLDLSANQIRRIENLDKLTQLQVLDLSDNQIQTEEGLDLISKLDKLKHLEISNNPFLQTIELLLSAGENHLEDIKNYLSAKEAEKSEAILPVKLMLLGNHAAGKTSFLHYLQKGELPEKTVSTHILSVQPYPENYKRRRKLLPTAVVYDFGGQDYYHGLYQAFFSLDAVNMLFWCNEFDKNQIRTDSNGATTRDYTRAYWLNQLQYAFEKRRTGDEKSTEPLLLVQTHADCEGEKRNGFKGDISQYNISDELYVALNRKKVTPESRYNLALQFLKQTLLDEIEQKRAEQKGEQPTYFVQFLKYILGKNTVKAIAIADLLAHYPRELKAGEEKIALLKADLKQLARRGLVLYYPDSDGIDDAVWLNPTKTIEYIHDKILSKSLVGSKEGKLSESEFAQVCNDNKIKQLLLNEKVVFYDAYNKQYIIPGYLPLAAEKDVAYDMMVFEFAQANFTLNFDNFIPFGLINQLICYYGGETDLKSVWRDQLIFTYKHEYKVWIKLDFTRLEIAVYICQRQTTDCKLKLREVEKIFFADIINLYWDNKPKYTALWTPTTMYKHMSSEKEINERNGLKYEQIWQEEIKCPDDLYISVDGKNFARYNDMEQAQECISTVATYPTKETGEIDKSVNRPMSVLKYKNFLNNKLYKQMKKIFISYSRKDVDYKDEMKKHLSILKMFDIADNWSCEEINIGKWDEQIQKELEESDMIIYMLSVNFFSSKYILEKEVLKGMQLIDAGKNKHVLCVIVSDFIGIDTLKQSIESRNTNETQDAILRLNEYQYLPYTREKNTVTGNSEEKIIPLKRHPNIEEAFTQITQQVQKVLK